MKPRLLAYASILAALLALDIVWLGGVAMPLYRRGIGPLMADPPNLAAAAFFYLFYAAGVLAFVVLPRRAESLRATIVWGALFGFMAYMTYDLTNLATLRDWPVSLTLVDMAWGCLATATAGIAGRITLDRLAPA